MIRDRDALSRAVMLGQLSQDFPVTALDGKAPVVVAHADETVAEVFERISWSDGYANLFVLMEDGRICLVAVMPPASSLHEANAEPIEREEIVRDSKIGMFADTIALYEDGARVVVQLGSAASTAEVAPHGQIERELVLGTGGPGPRHRA